MKNLVLLGLNYRLAHLELREQLTIGPEYLATVLADLSAHLASDWDDVVLEIALLSTCNRTELYLVAPDPALAVSRAQAYLESQAGMQPGALDGFLYQCRESHAARHLLSVAAGLDSMVQGEHQILGQVKDAFLAAQAAGCTGPLLSILFRTALTAGKRVRSETGIGHLSLSVATLVVERAQQELGTLSQRQALLVGAGKISALAARELVKAGLHCVLVANRTFARASRLAQSLGEGRGLAVHFDALPEYLRLADIAICSTGAPHIVLHAELLQQAMLARGNRPLFIADLAVPRDVDPLAGEISGVTLVNIDDLQLEMQAVQPLTAATLTQAQAILDEEMERLQAWCAERGCAPLVAALNQRAQVICAQELQRTAHRLGELTPAQEQALAAMARAIAGKLLHDPIHALKRPPDGSSQDEMLSAAEALFNLNFN